jgi:excisionase family DNA binding protein
MPDATPDNSGDNAPTGGDVSHPDFLSVAEAAKILGVSPRSIQRRCKAGTLSARLIQTKFGEAWEINRAEVEKATPEAATPARQGRDETHDKAPTEPRHVTPVADDLAARYIARLETENDFLRATVEQHQRSEAELRASLREALRAQPRQLTAGTIETAPSATDALTTTANRAEQQTQPTPDKTPQIAPEEAEAPADFEEIERMIHKVFGG